MKVYTQVTVFKNNLESFEILALHLCFLHGLSNKKFNNIWFLLVKYEPPTYAACITQYLLGALL